MNAILKLIEKRELYVHLILFKVYISTKGNTSEGFNGFLQKEVESLLGDKFNFDDYNTALEYLYSKGYTGFSNAEQLTVSGRDYVENWAREFENLEEEEKNELKKKLPERVIQFFKLTENATTIISFIQQLAGFN